MPIYQRGNSWLVSVGSKGDRYRQSFTTKEQAEEAELREMLARKAPRSPQAASEKVRRSHTLQEAYDLTMKLYWAGEKAEKTHKINAGQVVEFIGPDTPLETIAPETITEMVLEFEDRGNSGATVNKKVSCLSMMLKTAQEHDWLDKVPKMPRRKESKHRIRWLTDEEERRLLSICEFAGLEALRDYVVVAVDTGFRRGELLGFNPRDFSNGMLHLHAGSTKNDDARAIPATKRVADIIKKRSNSKTLFPELTPHILRFQWDKVRELMGLTEDSQFVVHMLRHTCASRLVQRNVPLKVVQQWMGHRNINTTLRYAHLAPDSLLVGVKALEEAPTEHLELIDF